MNNEQRKARQRAIFAAPEADVLDSLEPDYTDRCVACGESPTVTGERYGQRVIEWHLCGPCCFGEARMLNPREWNL